MTACSECKRALPSVRKRRVDPNKHKDRVEAGGTTHDVYFCAYEDELCASCWLKTEWGEEIVEAMLEAHMEALKP